MELFYRSFDKKSKYLRRIKKFYMAILRIGNYNGLQM
jgi:hypothetical protein